jgi:diketogulonate reductase-like aldo/keto reductase
VIQKELGRTGATISEVGLGTWKFRGHPDVLRRGIEAGSAFIDTAELYGNEELVGQVIRGSRDRIFVATKTHHWTRKDVLRCAEDSLRRLGIVTIDLYQLHRPNAAVPIEETMSAMEDLVRQGKVRYIGVSNFTVRELEAAQASLRTHRIVANQVRYSLVDRTIETELLPYCRATGVTIIAYSPLGGNFRALLEADPDNLLEKVAGETGKTRAQVALNWCLVDPRVVVIPKTDSAQRAVENCGASDWRLTDHHATLLREGIRFRRRTRLEIASRRFVRSAVQKLRGHFEARG